MELLAEADRLDYLGDQALHIRRSPAPVVVVVVVVGKRCMAAPFLGAAASANSVSQERQKTYGKDIKISSK